MKMKKIIAAALAMAMALSLVACGNGNKDNGSQGSAPGGSQSQGGGSQNTPDPAPGGVTELTLWTYPVGGWGKEANVQPIMDAFKAETGINVKVEYLAYGDGDDKVNSAITAKNAPDLIMEGPERLVANWGAKGYLVDLSLIHI